MQLLTPEHWKEYELIDSGNFEKLERYGRYVLRRPEPQAVWSKALSENEWQRMADASFFRDKKGSSGEEKGEWQLRKGMPGQWFVNYPLSGKELSMRLGLTSFKHVGLFPEQAVNWEFIFNSIQSLKTQETPRVLNLFAYTGGASLAAKAAGADVTHVDSVKQVINWSNENMHASNLSDIRWVVEDAMKYVRREVKRGKTYNGIILDPPAYGRGPEGEKWVLEESINELIENCGKLIPEPPAFFILNLYSMGLSALVAENLVNGVFQFKRKQEIGELYIPDKAGRRLPLGIFLRFQAEK
jgi:23S rRNA (cytosine1962-C5)-methyltransferase